MNERLYGVCADLSDAERRRDRKAFFGSIHGTLNHLLLADKIWLGRFCGSPFAARSLDQELHEDFAALRNDREATDARIEGWAAELTDEVLSGPLEYTTMVDPQPRQSALWLAATHFFNHQTHHRGQLTALLSQCGADHGVTDLMWLPDAAPASLHGEFAQARSSIDLPARGLNIHGRPSAKAVRSLLAGADLPTADLPDDLEHFLACGSPESPDGVIGLELHGHDALLRSLVVSRAMRGRGCGKALVDAVEAHARGAAVQRVFLLTETAEPFFASLGYRVVSRDEAPDAIRGSSEFSSLCPASAAFMCKTL